MTPMVQFKAIGGSLLRMGVDQAEGSDMRVVNQLLVSMTLGGMAILAVVGSFFIYEGAVAAAVTYFVYLAVNVVNLTLFNTGRLTTARFVVFQMVTVVIVAFLASVFLGGVVGTGGVFFYGFLSPLAGLLCFGARAALLAFAGFAASFAVAIVITVTGLVEPVLSDRTALVLLGFNITALGMFVIATLAFFVTQRNQAYSALKIEEDRTEALLLNILPATIAAQLKAGETRLAQHHDNATILFADVSNFTPLAARLAPGTVVDLLNEVFTEFDRLVERHGLEKIKTIGDAYMVAAGVPEPRPDHAVVMTQLALDMMAVVDNRRFQGCELTFRIGINSGPVVAGVIGQRKFSYDLWGDTVNTASRLEQFGIPGRIQISEATRALIDATYPIELRGQVDLKGKGLVTAYLLKPQPAPALNTADAPGTEPIPADAQSLFPVAPPQLA